MAVTRCLEKDPENRWPSADALRRALESRTVGSYRPTGTGWKAGRPESRPAGGGAGARRAPGTDHSYPASARAAVARGRASSTGSPRLGRDPLTAPAWRPTTKICRFPTPASRGSFRRCRGQFASWAAVSLGCFGINVATGIDHPWFLFPLFGMGIGLLRNYAQLWQAGYSWRDVAESPGGSGCGRDDDGARHQRRAAIARAAREEFGAHFGSVQQVFGDRQAILKLMEKLPASERKMLPEVQQTADALYNRATDLARTLHAMDSNFDTQGLGQIDERIAALSREADDTERARRLNLLERQRQTIVELQGRRTQVASHLESCVLAMQNMRFDLLRLRSAGVAAVLGDLTQATQQAKALSRDVDNAIAAAGEIREAMK